MKLQPPSSSQSARHGTVLNNIIAQCFAVAYSVVGDYVRYQLINEVR